MELQEFGAKSRICVLERKSSIGPCFRSTAPFGKPSGIAICMPKKFARFVGDEGTLHQSVINIKVSKKCLVNKTRSYIVNQEKEPTIDQVPQVKFFGSLKQKLSTMTEKIKDVLNS